MHVYIHTYYIWCIHTVFCCTARSNKLIVYFVNHGHDHGLFIFARNKKKGKLVQTRTTQTPLMASDSRLIVMLSKQITSIRLGAILQGAFWTITKHAYTNINRYDLAYTCGRRQARVP